MVHDICTARAMSDADSTHEHEQMLNCVLCLSVIRKNNISQIENYNLHLNGKIVQSNVKCASGSVISGTQDAVMMM